MNEETRKCNICKTIKPLSSFRKDRQMVKGYSYECKECYNKKYREKYYPENMKRIGFGLPAEIMKFWQDKAFQANKSERLFFSELAENWKGNPEPLKYAASVADSLKVIEAEKSRYSNFFTEEAYNNLEEISFPFRKRATEMTYMLCVKAFQEGFEFSSKIEETEITEKELPEIKKIDVKIPQILKTFLFERSSRSKTKFFNEVAENYEQFAVLPESSDILKKLHSQKAAKLNIYLERNNYIKIHTAAQGNMHTDIAELLYMLYDYALNNGIKL